MGMATGRVIKFMIDLKRGLGFGVLFGACFVRIFPHVEYEVKGGGELCKVGVDCRVCEPVPSFSEKEGRGTSV